MAHRKTHNRRHGRRHRRRQSRRHDVYIGGNIDDAKAFPALEPPRQANTIFSSPMVGGTHRKGCYCSTCKQGGMSGGGEGVPNGLTGDPYSASHLNQLPGVDGIDGNRNHYPLNTYPTDVSRQTVISLQGGRRKHHRRQTRKALKGGASLLPQDLVNLGRQFQFGVGSAYNALAGVAPPVNPMPWKDQLPLSKSAQDMLATL